MPLQFDEHTGVEGEDGHPLGPAHLKHQLAHRSLSLPFILRRNLPTRIIMYIVVHELAHLLHPNHGPEFWHCIARVLPDWAARAKWLEEHGARY